MANKNYVADSNLPSCGYLANFKNGTVWMKSYAIALCVCKRVKSHVYTSPSNITIKLRKLKHETNKYS